MISDYPWEQLVRLINNNRCIPFIGPEVHSPPTTTRQAIAIKWAEKYKYPLEDSDRLSNVAQYLAIISEDDRFPKQLLSEELRKEIAPNFDLPQYKDNPYAILAELASPIYVTTNYDKFMEKALMDKGREPVSEFCKWNMELSKTAKLLGYEPLKSEYRPNVSQPLVYHLHGIFDVPESMVLTDMDYCDFVINLIQQEEENFLPPAVRKALAITSLLFIGYSLDDMTFRVIYQALINMILTIERPGSIVLQLPYVDLPDKQSLQTELAGKQRLAAQEYLNTYIKDMFHLTVYWGDSQQFMEELRKRWQLSH